MISDPKVILDMDPSQNDRDSKADSEEEQVADVPDTAGELDEISLLVDSLRDCVKARKRRRKRSNLRRKRFNKRTPRAWDSPRFSPMVYIPKARYSHTKTS